MFDSRVVMYGITKYFMNVGNALSQLANVVFLNGKPNETLSGRFYREDWVAAKVLDYFFPGHCLETHLNERIAAREYLEWRREEHYE